ncbi:unnamed protein product [Prunus armeniaca]
MVKLLMLNDVLNVPVWDFSDVSSSHDSAGAALTTDLSRNFDCPTRYRCMISEGLLSEEEKGALKYCEMLPPRQEIQREAMDMYTGVAPYLYGVIHRLKHRWGYRRVEVEEEEEHGLINRRVEVEEEEHGLINRRFRVVGIAVIISRRLKNIMSGHMV